MLFIGIVVVGLLLFGNNSKAEVFLPYRSATPQIELMDETSTYPVFWKNTLNTAISTWNNSKTKVSIRKTSTSLNKFKVINSSYAWYGMCTSYLNSKKQTVGYVIEVNATSLIKAASGSNFSNYCRSTTTHEFGHVCGLEDNPYPATINKSLMNHNRNRAVTFIPTTQDLANINVKYK